MKSFTFSSQSITSAVTSHTSTMWTSVPTITQPCIVPIHPESYLIRTKIHMKLCRCEHQWQGWRITSGPRSQTTHGKDTDCSRSILFVLYNFVLPITRFVLFRGSMTRRRQPEHPGSSPRIHVLRLASATHQPSPPAGLPLSHFDGLDRCPRDKDWWLMAFGSFLRTVSGE